MSLSTPVIDELAAALGVTIAPELRAALVRIEVAERAMRVTGPVTAGVTGVTGVTPAAPSKAALRTRKWRAKVRAAAVQGVAAPSEASPSVTATVTRPSPVTSPTVTGDAFGDGGLQKENPPHPLKKNSPPKPPFRSRRRHAVTFGPPAEPVDRSQPDRRGRVWLHSSDPRYLEIRARRPSGTLATDGAGGWRFSPAEVAAAEERLATRVAALPPRSGAGQPQAPVRAGPGERRETGPPREMRSG